MAILKKKDIAEKGILDELNKNLETTVKLVEKLTEELVVLQKQTKEVNKTGSGSEAKERNELTKKLTATTKKLTKELTAQERVEKQIVAQNKKLSDSHTKQAKDLALVRQKTLQQNKALREQAKATLGVRKGISNLTKQMFAGVGIIAGFRALGGAIKAAFKTFVEFQKGASTLKAITQATSKEMKLLTKQAKELGAATSFTATQVLEADTALAKLGFTTKQITQSIPGVLDLAAATGTDLAQSAELAAATLRIFNLDASEMGRVSDVLAKSTSITSLSMEKLATIMPVVGKTAQIAGVSLERTAALAGTLTDRGLDASTSATALRNIFLKLAKDGRTWDSAMEEMNGSTDKLKTSIDLFGIRASAAGIILSETEETVNKFDKSLNKADGTSKRMAATMRDNVAGDIELAESAWASFILSIADGEGPISKVTRFAIKSFNELVTALTRLNNGESIRLQGLKDAENFESRLDVFRKKQKNNLEGINEEQGRNLIILGKQQILRKRLLKIQQELSEEEENSKGLARETAEVIGTVLTGAQFKSNKEKLTRIQLNRDLVLGQIKVLENLREVGSVLPVVTDNQNKDNAATKEAIKLKKEEAAIIESRKKDQVDTFETTINRDAVDLEPLQDQLDAEAELRETNRQIELEKEQQWADAKTEIALAAAEEAGQLVRDIFASFQDEKLAKLNSDAEAEKAILQDRLDKGIISEEQFAKQTAEIEKKQRIASAKAEKKKALFDVVINTILAVIKTFANLGFPAGLIPAIAVSALGTAQTIAIAAKPIPEFAEGEVNINGKSHKQGGINANIEGGESVIKKSATADSEGILNMVNDGLLTDKGFNKMDRQDNNMLVANLLMNQNDTSKQMLTALLNGKFPITRNGITEVWGADGSLEKFLTDK